jgi:hypothetical protein
MSDSKSEQSEGHKVLQITNPDEQIALQPEAGIHPTANITSSVTAPKSLQIDTQIEAIIDEIVQWRSRVPLLASKARFCPQIAHELVHHFDSLKSELVRIGVIKEVYPREEVYQSSESSLSQVIYIYE